MTHTIAFECYADEDLFHVLREVTGLPLFPLHQSGHGEVVNSLLRRQRAKVGIIDEDPGKTHHRGRATMSLRQQSVDLEWRESEGRHLLIVKPELEECFLKSIKTLGLPSELPSKPLDLRELLAIPNTPKHQSFRNELSGVHRVGLEKGVETFISAMAEILIAVLPNPSSIP